jgi:hypothetical protein
VPVARPGAGGRELLGGHPREQQRLAAAGEVERRAQRLARLAPAAEAPQQGTEVVQRPAEVDGERPRGRQPGPRRQPS